MDLYHIGPQFFGGQRKQNAGTSPPLAQLRCDCAAPHTVAAHLSPIFTGLSRVEPPALALHWHVPRREEIQISAGEVERGFRFISRF